MALHLCLNRLADSLPDLIFQPTGLGGEGQEKVDKFIYIYLPRLVLQEQQANTIIIKSMQDDELAKLRVGPDII